VNKRSADRALAPRRRLRAGGRRATLGNLRLRAALNIERAYLFNEVFDLKPTSRLLWSINITAELMSRTRKAAIEARTLTRWNSNPVLETGRNDQRLPALIHFRVLRVGPPSRQWGVRGEFSFNVQKPKNSAHSSSFPPYRTVSAKGAGSCKPAAAGKSFPQKRALNLLGSKADSVEPKAKKPGSLSDH
jgi:hypothetical protein